MKTKVFAKPTHDIQVSGAPEIKHFTAGKEYRVLYEDKAGGFDIVDDHGNNAHCLWEGCAFQSLTEEKSSWERIERDEKGNRVIGDEAPPASHLHPGD